MTRRRLNRTLAAAIAAIALYAVAMVWARFTPDQDKLFDLLKEAAPLAVGVGAAILANAFQKRSAFVGFLRDEWYNIVEMKTALIVFCRTPDKTVADGLEAWAKLSTAIDRMRILYKNVGETRSHVGYYPFEPLHDMRRCFEEAMGLEPSEPGAGAPRPMADADWPEVERKIWRAFQALREVFLEELDITEPDTPLLARDQGRSKEPGAPRRAEAKRRRADRQSAA